MEQIERIQHYETLLDRITPVLENLRRRWTPSKASRKT
jgi:hypothetical protein